MPNSTFQSLNLIEPILNALEKKSYTIPTPIQAQAIPHLLEGKDFLGIAQTGTGKTAAFALPILNNLAKNRREVKSKRMRTLILTPTRELASQIADNIEVYGKGLGLKHVVIFGGVGENPQITAMKKGVDIVIATPGRLLDLTNQGFIEYYDLEVFVLDEADRMLDMGFINDIKKIIKKLPEKRQTLFFSATMPRTIADLAHSILNDPIKVEVTPQATTVEKIDQKVHFVEKTNKPLLLKYILEQPEAKAVLVFCKMKHGANRVVEYLERHSIKAEAIHGNKSQSARERALQKFRDGECQVLVATDIAARGIDIPGVTHVINFDIPQEPESYVHRIGRTARAGREGIAIAFCEPMERGLLKAVEKVIKRPIPVDNNHPFFGVEGTIIHRKISSGRPVGAARSAGERGSNRDASERRSDAKPTGSRIFAAKSAGGSDSSRSHSAPAHRSRSTDSRGGEARGERSGSRNDSRPNPNRSGNRDRRPTDSEASAGQESRRSGAPRSHSGSSGARSSNARPNSQYAKTTPYRSRSGPARNAARKAGSGAVKTKIGKIVNWFKKVST